MLHSFISTILVLLVAVFSLSASAVTSTFDLSTAIFAASLCALAYCPPPNYLTLNYSSLGTDFAPSLRIYDADSDTNGLVGYSAARNSIVVAFRGSEDIKNWLSDFDLRRRGYPLCNATCQVHEGFYDAAMSVSAAIKTETTRLKQLYPSAAVLVTGHSLGAALATLTAIELQLNSTATPVGSSTSAVELYTFGSPRVFNPAGAAFASSLLGPASRRFTHTRDVVPHTPLLTQGYQHIAVEYYEGVDRSVVQCQGPEDKDCADQWAVQEWSFRDHLHYLNITMVPTCEIVQK